MGCRRPPTTRSCAPASTRWPAWNEAGDDCGHRARPDGSVVVVGVLQDAACSPEMAGIDDGGVVVVVAFGSYEEDLEI